MLGASFKKPSMLEEGGVSSCVSITNDIQYLMEDAKLQLYKLRHGIEGDSTQNDLKADETRLVIRKYLEMDAAIKIQPEDNCIFGVGYNMCDDIVFRSPELFKVLEPRINALEKEEGKPIEAKVHPQITNLREFAETFAYQFKHGANAERVCSSKELFDSILAELYNEDNKLYPRTDLGGHSAVWALRSQREGCKVYSAAQSYETVDKNLRKINKDLVVWPEEEVKAFVPKGKGDKIDIHMVLEYAEGDTILNGRFKAPRSNRFYFVHDPNGGKLRQLELYHSILSEKKIKEDVRRHMFGGYQLLQRLDAKRAEERLSKQAQLWRDMRAQGEQAIHVEFADFSDSKFFELFEKYVVRESNSLGMNEQEMLMLIDYWAGKSDLDSAKDSSPSFQDIIGQLKTFFKSQKEMGLDISRVHLHPYGSFFMCYDTNKWHDARDAIIKSSIAVPKYCIDPTKDSSVFDNIGNFEVGDRPDKFEHPNKPGEFIEIEKDKLLYDFELTDGIHCYLQFFIKCKRVFKTAGLGDTISGTGFIYHQPKLSN